MQPFRSTLARDTFIRKYALRDDKSGIREEAKDWSTLARTLVECVMDGLVPQDVKDATYEFIRDMKFIPGGRYLYYAGRPRRFFNNCFVFKSMEDTRENWAELAFKATSALMSGGGIGNDYSVYRPEGSILRSTGGTASGPIPLMMMIDNIGRNVMQGGSRRSAIYASLDETHDDVWKFLYLKDWERIQIPGTNLTLKDVKAKDFTYPAPMEFTNISVNYRQSWLDYYLKTGDPGEVFIENVRQALRTGEPGFSFNFGDKDQETGRNACTEVTSADDGDVCNLGSLNMERIDSLEEWRQAVELATIFLLCGTITGEVPLEIVARVREKNRRLGLGIMGFHAWSIKRGLPYGVSPEMRPWLEAYRDISAETAKRVADQLGVSRPVATRAIAPTGTLALLADTTSGIEPLYATAYKRRYLKGGSEWYYQYQIDSICQIMVDEYGIDPDKIETASDLAYDFERRIRTQAEVQDYVDMGISSTINLPAWGTDHNNKDLVMPFAEVLAKYAPRLRGFTCYPDGARDGQPLTVVPYHEAKANLGKEFREMMVFADVCDITGKGGTCEV